MTGFMLFDRVVTAFVSRSLIVQAYDICLQCTTLPAAELMKAKNFAKLFGSLFTAARRAIKLLLANGRNDEILQNSSGFKLIGVA